MFPIEAQLDVQLPDDYKRYLLHEYTGEAFVGDGAYLALLHANELFSLRLEGMHGVLVVIGTNGGGDNYVLQLHQGRSTYWQIPSIGAEKQYANYLGSTCAEFIRALETLS